MGDHGCRHGSRPSDHAGAVVGHVPGSVAGARLSTTLPLACSGLMSCPTRHRGAATSRRSRAAAGAVNGSPTSISASDSAVPRMYAPSWGSGSLASGTGEHRTLVPNAVAGRVLSTGHLVFLRSGSHRRSCRPLPNPRPEGLSAPPSTSGPALAPTPPSATRHSPQNRPTVRPERKRIPRPFCARHQRGLDLVDRPPKELDYPVTTRNVDERLTVGRQGQHVS